MGAAPDDRAAREFLATISVGDVLGGTVAEVTRSHGSNGEARMSLRALRPDPFREFADGVAAGRVLRGRITRVVPFGAFVEVADGVEGLLPHRAGEAPDEVVGVGDEIAVVVAELDRTWRRLTLSRHVP